MTATSCPRRCRGDGCGQAIEPGADDDDDGVLRQRSKRYMPGLEVEDEHGAGCRCHGIAASVGGNGFAQADA